MKNRNEILKSMGMEKPYHMPEDGSRHYGNPDHDQVIREAEFYREHMSFDLDLVAGTGREFKFYGAHSCMFKLDSITLEAIEDPNDGYRSYLNSIVITKEEEGTPGGFFKTPLANVRIVSVSDPKKVDYSDYTDGFEGWAFIDADDGHIWLVVGTSNTNDYYPGFTFDYRPKKGKAT